MTQIKKHIPLQQLAEFHQVSVSVITELADFGLIEIIYSDNKPCIPTAGMERCERVLRLYRDLGINKEGIEIILELRERIAGMQQELNRLRHQLKKHEERRSVFFRDEFFDAD